MCLGLAYQRWSTVNNSSAGLVVQFTRGRFAGPGGAMWVEVLLPRAHTLHLQNKIHGHAESLEIIKLNTEPHYSDFENFTRAKHSKTYVFRYNIFKHQISILSGQVMSYFIQKSIVENTAS